MSVKYEYDEDEFVDAVVEAQKKTGIVPVKGVFQNSDGGCALTILARANGLESGQALGQAMFPSRTGFFTTSFDAPECVSQDAHEARLGAACHRALFEQKEEAEEESAADEALSLLR